MGQFRILTLASLALTHVACTGILGGALEGEDSLSDEDAAAVEAGKIGNGLTGDDWRAAPLNSKVVYSPTARLTSAQYRLSILEAFGVDPFMPMLPVDEQSGLHPDPEAPPLEDYEVYLGAASALGDAIAPTLLESCDFAADVTGCTNTLFAPAIRHLYRTAADPADSAEIAAVIGEALTRTGDATSAVSLGVARALLDARFLYRIESGQGAPNAAGGLALSSHEMATRLSFVTQGSPPDAALLGLADSGLILETDSLASEAARLTESEGSRAIIWNFVRKWLRLGDPSIETDSLKLAMLEETKRLVEHVLIDEKAPFSDLFRANYSFLNAELAAHYGVPAPTTDWELYEFPPEARRRGVLTHASFLTANSAHSANIAWIFRGKIVYEHLFCGEMPAPPEGAAEAEVEDRTTTPPCSSCHANVDPMGQFFDRFDEYGALKDAALAPGVVSLGSDIDQDYADLMDFLDGVADSRALRHCFVKLWMQSALGREIAEVDQASFDAALSAFQETDSLSALLQALFKTESFQTLYPKPEAQICQ